MRLVNSSLFLDISLQEGETVTLVVEKPDIMVGIVEDLSRQCIGLDGEFFLSDGQKMLTLEKVAECIIDPFTIDFNHRKIINKLYSDLVAVEEYFSQDKADLNAKLVRYLDNLINESPYSFVTMDLELDTSKLLKMYNVHIEPEYHSLLEKLGEYAKLISLVLKKRLLILVNVRDYLTNGEIELLIQTVAYLKVSLLLIEGHEHDFDNNHVTWIIDHDNCMIKK